MDEFVVYRSGSFGGNPDYYHAGRIAKRTEKRITLAKSTGTDRQIGSEAALFVSADHDAVVELAEALRIARRSYEEGVRALRQKLAEEVARLVEEASEDAA